MTIGGFKITKKHFMVIGGIVLVIGVFSLSNHLKEQQKADEAKKKAQEAAEEYQKNHNQGTEFEYDYDSALQANLKKKYGEPPEGFRWTVTGELEAIGSDTMTAEDVLYTYLRSLSMLDFYTAQEYSEESNVVSTYQDYYENYGIEDYYDDFLRKQYKYALTTLEILQIGDTAVFADGTENVTVKLNMIDLTNKDFWLKDKNELFDKLYEYNVYQDDETKAEQYLYDYIYKVYEAGSLPKKEKDVEIVLGKSSGGGWLVTNDKELDAALGYDWGTDIAKFILDEYQDYELNRTLKESMGKK